METTFGTTRSAIHHRVASPERRGASSESGRTIPLVVLSEREVSVSQSVVHPRSITIALVSKHMLTVLCAVQQRRPCQNINMWGYLGINLEPRMHFYTVKSARRACPI